MGCGCSDGFMVLRLGSVSLFEFISLGLSSFLWFFDI